VDAKAAAVAANPRRRAEARREAALVHLYTSRAAAAVPWAERVRPKGRPRPFLARVPGREVAGVRVIRVFSTLFGAAGAKVAAVAANPRRRAEARCEAYARLTFKPARLFWGELVPII
jgi:hypothetical protein